MPKQKNQFTSNKIHAKLKCFPIRGIILNSPLFRKMSRWKLSFFDIQQVETTPFIKMERYTLQERIEIIKLHYKNNEYLTKTVRKTRIFLGRREAPCRTAMKKLVEKFELLGQVSDVKNKTRACRSRTAENNTAVARSVKDNPGFSILRRSLELDISQTSLHRIMHKDLVVYEVQLTQELKPADHQLRRVFADWVVEMRTLLSLEEVFTIGYRDLVI